jgi:hypothetical protein
MNVEPACGRLGNDHQLKLTNQTFQGLAID